MKDCVIKLRGNEEREVEGRVISAEVLKVEAEPINGCRAFRPGPTIYTIIVDEDALDRAPEE